MWIARIAKSLQAAIAILICWNPGEVLMLHYGVPKSHEILRFVCLQKVTKQSWMIQLYGATALFGIFLETNIKISQDLATWLQTSKSQESQVAL